MAVYPATNNAEAIDLNISNANQFFTILKGGLDDSIPTYEGHGDIPSVAKALAEAAAYKPPIPWQTSGVQSDILQPRIFNNTIYVPRNYNVPFNATPNPAYWRLLQPNTEVSQLVERYTSADLVSGTLTLTDIEYTPSKNQLIVFVDGAYQVSGEDYTEDNSTQITFTPNLTGGEEIVVIAGVIISGTPTPPESEVFNADRVNRQQTALQRSVKQSGDDLDQTLRSDFANQSFARGDKAVGFIEFTEEFDEQYDFSRGSEATYIDATGVLRTAAVDEPRFTHDPETGEPQGLLIEEQRTNLLLWSEDFTQGVWIKNGVTVTPSVEPDPSGAGSAYLIESTGNDPSNRLEQSVGVQQNTDYTITGYLKLPQGATGSEFINFNVRAGSGATSVEVHEVVQVTGEWTRFLATINSGENTTLSVRPYRELYSTSFSVLSTKVQVEQASTPSSYIPTTDSQVTRAADQVSRELGSEFNASEGTFVFEGTANNVDGSTYSAVVCLGALSSNRLLLATGGSASVSRVVRYDPAGNSNYTTGGIPQGQKYKAAITFSAGQGVIRVAQNGSVSSGPANFTSPVTPEMFLGSFGGGTPRASGEFGTVHYFPRALSEQELIALTAPE